MLPLLSSTWLWWTSLFIVAFLSLLLILQIKIELYAARENENDLAWMKISWWKLTYKLIIPKFKWSKKGLKLDVEPKPGKHEHEETELEIYKAMVNIEAWTEALGLIKEVNEWVHALLKKVKLERWEWHSHAGTGDAMTAAMSCGLLWSVKGLLLGAVTHHVKLTKAPHVTIQPNFQQAVFETRLSCVARVRLIYLFIAGIKLLFHIGMIKRTIHMWKMVVAR